MSINMNSGKLTEHVSAGKYTTCTWNVQNVGNVYSWLANHSPSTTRIDEASIPLIWEALDNQNRERPWHPKV